MILPFANPRRTAIDAHPAGKSYDPDALRGYASTAGFDADLYDAQADHVRSNAALLPYGPVRDRECELASAIENLAEVRRRHARELDALAADITADGAS